MVCALVITCKHYHVVYCCYVLDYAILCWHNGYKLSDKQCGYILVVACQSYASFKVTNGLELEKKHCYTCISTYKESLAS